jgi:hypothetical protein
MWVLCGGPFSRRTLHRPSEFQNIRSVNFRPLSIGDSIAMEDTCLAREIGVVLCSAPVKKSHDEFLHATPKRTLDARGDTERPTSTTRVGLTQRADLRYSEIGWPSTTSQISGLDSWDFASLRMFSAHTSNAAITERHNCTRRVTRNHHEVARSGERRRKIGDLTDQYQP